LAELTDEVATEVWLLRAIRAELVVHAAAHEQHYRRVDPRGACGWSASRPAGRTMLHDRIGGRDEYALVTVAPSYGVRRTSVLAMDLGDHAVAIFLAHVVSLDNDLIAHFCAHQLPPVLRRRFPC
jgi:hypothetical protein